MRQLRWLWCGWWWEPTKQARNKWFYETYIIVLTGIRSCHLTKKLSKAITIAPYISSIDHSQRARVIRKLWLIASRPQYLRVGDTSQSGGYRRPADFIESKYSWFVAMCESSVRLIGTSQIVLVFFSEGEFAVHKGAFVFHKNIIPEVQFLTNDRINKHTQRLEIDMDKLSSISRNLKITMILNHCI